MGTAPRSREWDATFALLREGYPFISNRCEALGSDVFRTRLGLESTICMRGRDAAALFYDESRFRRRDAMPAAMLAVLQGRGVAASLDDEAHLRRKRLVMSFMTPDRLSAFRADFERRWRAAEADWAKRGEVVLLDAARDEVGGTMIAWCGLDRLDADERRTLIEAGAACVEGVAPFKIASHLAARRARSVMDALLAREIEATRREPDRAPEGSPLRVIALHEEDGGRLPTPVAAAELENLIRPAVAVGRFIAYGARALAISPGWREPLAAGDAETVRGAAMEARRLCPLFPFIPARARTSFEWGGVRFEEGTRVLLDLYGTNRHPALYDAPDAFRPERWRGVEPGPFSLIPQGGGAFEGHRCAGEWITQAVVETALRRLMADLDYEPAEGATEVPLDRLPSAPRGGFTIRGVRMREAAAA